MVITETFCPASRQEWRDWLQANHASRQSIWLIYYKKQSGKQSLTWSEAVDEALCFGWIDSTRKTIDDEQFVQFFCRRKPNSGWSKINKEKIERLTASGLMFPAGLAAVETAKLNGSWTTLDEVEDLTVPEDLEQAFGMRPGSETFFAGLSKSQRKIMLHWITTAKRPETRQKRIDELAALAAQQLKPKQFR
jgi:uncharacterized protein YdeI (YjbR/CyaY-like superfamily)